MMTPEHTPRALRLLPRRRRSFVASALAAGLIVAAFGSGGAATAVDAPSAGPIVDYRFDQTSGATVPNLAEGSAFGDATVENADDDQWSGDALTLTGGGNGNWVHLPSSLLTGSDSATITTEVKLDAAMKSTNHFLWNIGNSGNGSYFFASLKDTPRVAITTSAWGGEVNARAINNFEADRWYSVTAVLDGADRKLRLYVDGHLLSVSSTDLTPASITDQSLNTIGRSPYGDPLFAGAVSHFRVYDRALSAAEIVDISDSDAAPHPGGNPERAVEAAKELNGPLTISDSITTLPDLADAHVTWSTTAADAVVDADGHTLRVTQPANGSPSRDLPLTAAVSVRGSVVERTVVATVQPEAAATDPYGYLLVHFIEDANGYAEKIYLDVSRGNNPEQWDPLNGGQPILASALGTTGARDPYITRNPETGKYYIIATDLRVFGGDGRDYSKPCQEWCHWQTQGSNNLIVWESDDLVTWSTPRSLNVAPPGGRLGMAWAPETTWVPDYNGTGKGAFVVYWSSTISEGGDNYSSGRILWGATTDFTQDTFTYGGTSLDEGGFTIDASVLQNDGKTYRVAKDQRFGANIFLQVTDSPTWWKGDTQWTRIQDNVGHEYGGVEGPAGFKRNDAGRWYLYVDVIPAVGYRPMSTTDLDEGFAPLDSKTLFMSPSTKHGGVLGLTKADYDRVRAADAIAATSTDIGEVRTTVGSDASSALPRTTEVTTAYGRPSQLLPVTWDVAGVDTSTEGSYTVTGVVRSIGANDNDWVGDGGSTLYTAANKRSFSNSEITVTATVVVTAAEPSPSPTPTEATPSPTPTDATPSPTPTGASPTPSATSAPGPTATSTAAPVPTPSATTGSTGPGDQAPTAAPVRGDLAATGAEGPLGAALLAMGLLVAGGVLWATRRHRRSGSI